MRRPLTPELIKSRFCVQPPARRGKISMSARQTGMLRGWKVRPREPSGDWVLLFHGVSDNRVGVLGHAEFLLRHGYSLVMVDARAHRASDGGATYGWKEREDTRAIVDALIARESVQCLFALGESMGGAIALQSAAVEPRIAGVVAESAFSDVREVGYDYAGLHLSPWLGKTLFRPGIWAGLPRAEAEGGFRAEDVSPERAVASRAFPVLLICDTEDRTIPCRHSERIYKAATGRKSLWVVLGAQHAAALASTGRVRTARGRLLQRDSLGAG
jgi:pimeloyl-ACP methyl ester carboxylesterase